MLVCPDAPVLNNQPSLRHSCGQSVQIYRAADGALLAQQDAVEIACVSWHSWLPLLAVSSLESVNVQRGVGHSRDAAKKGGSWDLNVMVPAGDTVLLPKNGLPEGNAAARPTALE